MLSRPVSAGPQRRSDISRRGGGPYLAVVPRTPGSPGYIQYEGGLRPAVLPGGLNGTGVQAAGAGGLLHQVAAG